MSVLSFADVALFLFIVVRGTFRDLKCILFTMARYFKSKNVREGSLEHSIEDGHDQTHGNKNEELEGNKEIENLYVSTILIPNNVSENCTLY